MANLVRPSIFDLDSLNDPLLSTNYRVVFELPSGLLSSISAYISSKFTHVLGAGKPFLGTNIAQVFQTSRSELLALRCSAVSLGKTSIEPIYVQHKGFKAVYAGQRTQNNTLNMTFVEDQELLVMSIIRSWMTGARNPTDYKSSNRDNLARYTGKIIVIAYQADGTYASEYVYENAWPTDLDDVNLGAETEIVSVSASFAYDRCGFYWEWKEALWNWIG